MSVKPKPEIVAESPTLPGIGDENAQPPANLAAPVAPPPPPETGKFIEKASKANIPIVNGVMKPDTFEGMFRIADLFWNAGMCPQGVGSAATMMVALMAGQEIGLSPTQSIQNIMVINNRPTLWGDAPLGVVQSTGILEDIEETLTGDGEAMVATCTIKRRDRKTPTVRVFSAADAKTAGLWGKGGPWRQYPKRMLQLRARGFALRDSCPEILKGLGIAEEVADFTIENRPNRQVSGTAAPVDLSSLPQKPETSTTARVAAPNSVALSGAATPPTASTKAA